MQDIAEYTESPQGRMLSFFDFLQVLFHVSQFAERLAFVAPVERLVRFVDGILVPKLKLNLGFYKGQKNYYLANLKIKKNPLKALL